jgi:hypothetical protein
LRRPGRGAGGPAEAVPAGSTFARRGAGPRGAAP